MIKTEYHETNNYGCCSNVCTRLLGTLICVVAMGTFALPAGAVSQTTSRIKKRQPSSEAPRQSEESPAQKTANEKSRYFRAGLSVAFGRYRYEEEWKSIDSLDEIGRYQGPGMEAAMELGRQRKSGFAFGAQFQLGSFPALKRFSLDSDSYSPASETMKIKYLMVGLVFLHHPFGLNNGFYFAIRPGISQMHGLRDNLPYPIPCFDAALGYDFFSRAKAHLGVEAKMTTVFGIGHMKGDSSSGEVRGRLISFGLAFTVAYY